ncbi:MAG: hypothetical protein HC853_00300 [Anaerolineae bacterium]|nr:hypothetical protein [Anaerolineae bacterium]
MKISPHIRIGLTLLGALLVIGAFLANLYVGAANNPPPLRIVVAARDLQAGDRLQIADVAVEDQIINPSLSRLYVQEAEINAYVDTFVVDPIRRGDPLNKVKFANKANGTQSRYGLVLTNTQQVVMVLPVSPDIIPSKLKGGDFINILFAAGEGGLNRLPDNQASAQIAVPTAIANPNLQEVAGLEMTISVSTTRPVNLPLADVLLEHVEVLDVNFQQVQNPNYGSDTTRAEQPWLIGPISSVVVRVPRSYQTLLSFAAANGKVRYAISSPMLTADQIQPQAGVDWGKIVALYRWKDEQAIGRGETLTQTLYPGYVASQLALPQTADAMIPGAVLTTSQPSTSAASEPAPIAASPDQPVNAEPTAAPVAAP